MISSKQIFYPLILFGTFCIIESIEFNTVSKTVLEMINFWWALMDTHVTLQSASTKQRGDLQKTQKIGLLIIFWRIYNKSLLYVVRFEYTTRERRHRIRYLMVGFDINYAQLRYLPTNAHNSEHKDRLFWFKFNMKDRQIISDKIMNRGLFYFTLYLVTYFRPASWHIRAYVNFIEQ